ncbi:DUF6378 domain-containing protein [Selenomonadales bacterium OttesenSCG-928-I06]|nr:DUF6378 domain-containing protein [Selenomonadales bacterium OttesenSCG-928-I06]
MEEKRSIILDTAKKYVLGDREQDYGTVSDNFKKIAELWSVYLGFEMRAGDVAMMMILLKVARCTTGEFKEDTLIDIAGYAACANEVKEG